MEFLLSAENLLCPGYADRSRCVARRQQCAKLIITPNHGRRRCFMVHIVRTSMSTYSSLFFKEVKLSIIQILWTLNIKKYTYRTNKNIWVYINEMRPSLPITTTENNLLLTFFLWTRSYQTYVLLVDVNVHITFLFRVTEWQKIYDRLHQRYNTCIAYLIFH